MDRKRDAQSQRSKNLQYKSRGRGRHPGRSGEPPANDIDVTQSRKEAEGRPETFGAKDRLGSNWDRYAEPEEVDVVNYSTGEVAAKKRSEGLDYSALLEEADALVRDGAASLLRHFTLDQDAEDVFLSDDPEEQPLPLSIDLSALNEGLSQLSLAERLGLEEELFSSGWEQGEAARPATVAQSLDKEPDDEIANPLQPASKDTHAAGPSDSQTRGREAKGLQNIERESHAMLESIPETQSRSLPAGPSSARNISQPPNAELTGSESGSQSVSGEKGPPSGAQQPTQSPSGRKEDEDADLLDLLLTGNERGPEKGKRPPTEGRSARSAAKGGPLSEWGGEGRLPEESKHLVRVGNRNLPLRKGDLLDQPSGAREQSFKNTIAGFSRTSLGADSHARRAKEKSVSSLQQNETSVPSPEHDIDALLDVLTPPVLDQKEGIPPSRPAAAGAWASSSNGRDPDESVPSKSRPNQNATSNSVTGVGGSQGLGKGVPRMKQQGKESISAPPQHAASDQDFDAWLDSLS